MNKDIFKRYEKIRLSGVTHMFNVKTISKLANISLDDVLYIMDNYTKLNKKYGNDKINKDLWKEVMKLGKNQKKRVSNKLSKDDIDTILATMEYYGAMDVWLKQTFFDLQLAKYKLYDWLAMCIMSRNNGDRETNNTALKVLVHAYLKVGGNVVDFVNDLRETDYDMITDWEKIEIDKESEEWDKEWDVDHPKQSKENVKVTMDLGKLAIEQEESLMDDLIQGVKDAVVCQEQIDSEVEEDMNNLSKTEKPLTQKEADRLYFIGLMNPSDEDLKDWDSRYDESMKEDE